MRIDQLSAPRYTVDEIDSWPDNRYELLDGVLLVTPAPGPPHQLVATEIAHILAGLLEPWPSLRVAAPGVIVLRPRTQLIPDVLVFERPPCRDQLRWAPPDLGATLTLPLERVFRDS